MKELNEIVTDEDGKKWEKIMVTIDSGAAENVAPPSVGVGFMILYTLSNAVIRSFFDIQFINNLYFQIY